MSNTGGTGQICYKVFFAESLLKSCRHPAGGKQMSTGHLHLMVQICPSWISPKRKSTPLGVLFFLEVPARFELADESFADSCLTTWPRYHMKLGTPCVPNCFGAGDEARTRYLHLGKVALYRMSYARRYGASGRNRTNDTRIFSPLLYLLSYRGILSRALSSAQLLYGDPERTRTVDLQRDRLAC